MFNSALESNLSTFCLMKILASLLISLLWCSMTPYSPKENPSHLISRSTCCQWPGPYALDEGWAGCCLLPCSSCDFLCMSLTGPAILCFPTLHVLSSCWVMAKVKRDKWTQQLSFCHSKWCLSLKEPQSAPCASQWTWK